MRVGSETGKRARDALSLQTRELHRELLTLGRNEQETMPAVVRPFFLQHVTFINELLENAPERLLGDAQRLQKVGDLHSRIAIDEMQHTVMRPAEAEFFQHVVGL